MLRQPRACLYAFLVLLIPAAAVQLGQVYADFPAPGELTYPDSMIVYHARDVQRGGAIYKDFNQPPHVLALYGPLTYLLPGLIGRAVEADVDGLFRIGRSISLLATAGGLLVMVLLLRRERVSWLPIVIVLLAYLSSPILWPASVTPRADAVITMLELTGLLVFASARGPVARWLPLPLFLTAFLFKQSAFVPVVVAAVSVLVTGHRRFAIGWSVAAAAAYGGTFFLVNALTGGMYALNTLGGMSAHVTPANLWTVMVESALIPGIAPMVIAFAAVARRVRLRTPPSPIELYAVLSFLVACAAVLRDGSAENYFIAPLAASCVVLGGQLQRWLAAAPTADAADVQAERPAETSWAVALMLLFCLGHAGRAAVNYGTVADLVKTRTEAVAFERELITRAAEFFNRRPGPALSQDDSVSLHLDRPLCTDLMTMAALADNGVFDDHGVIERLRRGEVAGVLLKTPLRPGLVPRYQSTDWVRREWLEAMLDAGYVEGEFGPWFFYIPPPPVPTAE